MSQDARYDEELATQRRAAIVGLPYVDTSGSSKPLFPAVLTVPELKELRVIPIRVDQDNIVFGVTNMTSQQTMKALKQRFLDQQISFGLISDNGFQDYIKLYDPPKKVVYQEIDIKSAGNTQLIEQVSATLSQVRADDMLAYLVQQAHRLNASDIHLESGDKQSRVRFRIDGVLHSIANIPLDRYRVLISAIASAGNISTSAEDAQQGHISQHLKMADKNEVDINLRLETAQTINGMDVVMRLFNMEQSMYSLDKLGLSASERRVVDDIIAKPSGLVLVVGPTGSGKTTTLYSMLNSLNNDERKIITIEDPVEYRFNGISQISVKTKTTTEVSFAEKLRAVLRLDPDIVMVGEIRDMDTAKTSLQAALTGHLVLSTFHASSAAAALTRLQDITNENPLFISAIRLVMAQRLVRRLDPDTKQPYSPDEATIKRLQSIISTLPPDKEKPDLSNLQLYKATPSTDNPYGYKGQLALREQFVMKGAIRELLEKTSETNSSQAIEQSAIASGMVTMLQDGILKVIAGETTIEEVFRVIG